MNENSPKIKNINKSIDEDTKGRETIASITIAEDGSLISHLDGEILANPELCSAIADNCIVILSVLAKHSNDEQLKRFSEMMGCEI